MLALRALGVPLGEPSHYVTIRDLPTSRETRLPLDGSRPDLNTAWPSRSLLWTLDMAAAPVDFLERLGAPFDNADDDVGNVLLQFRDPDGNPLIV